MNPYKNQHKTQDPRSQKIKKIKENFTNMACKEKFNFNEVFISECEKRRICGTYGVENAKIGMLKRQAWND